MPTVEETSARRIEELVRRIETIPDPESRGIVRQLLESILELHGSGLQRMMEIASAAGDSGEVLIRRFAGDNLVAALLVLHDLHPDDLYTRVQRALGKWHGTAELVGEFEGVIRVRLSGAGCGVRDAVEVAIREAAPDAAEIIIQESFQPAAFVPLSALAMHVAEAD